jgi:hypothetical protein
MVIHNCLTLVRKIQYCLPASHRTRHKHCAGKTTANINKIKKEGRKEAGVGGAGGMAPCNFLREDPNPAPSALCQRSVTPWNSSSRELEVSSGLFRYLHPNTCVYIHIHTHN